MANHEPDGAWLYGVEMATHPDYRRRGIGSALYKARFALVKQLNLRGWYACGMLMGYHRYQGQLSLHEYAEKVKQREIYDPTVTMQMNQGFRAVGLVENYVVPEPSAGNAAMLIVWDNPEYRAPEHESKAE